MSKIDELKIRLNEYKNLSQLLATKDKQIAPNGSVIVYLGDGYFCDMKLDRAKSFVHDRVLSLQSQFDKLCYIEGITEDGLPIMEIHEELDEDGNVIDSKVEHTGTSMESIKGVLNEVSQKMQQQQTHKKQYQLENQQPKIQELPQSPPQKALSTSKKDDNTSDSVVEIGDIVERNPPLKPQQATSHPTDESMDDMGAPSPTEEPIVELKPSDSTGINASTSFHGISHEDMLELEIMNEELEEMHVRMDEEEALDDDFDDEYEMEYDEDASEESDEDEFGRSRGSLFPGDPRTAAILQQHMNNPNALKSHLKVPSDDDDTLPSRKKSVSFAPELEVREFETSSDERKGGLIDDRPPQVSLFKQQVKLNHAINSDGSVDLERPNKKISLFKQQRGSGDFNSGEEASSDRPATSDIVERPVAESSPSPTLQQYPEASTSTNTPVSSKQTTERAPYSRKYNIPSNKGRVGKPIAVPKTERAVPPEFVQHTNDLNEIDLKQLEPDALRYFDEATIPDDKFLDMHDKDTDEEEGEAPRITDVSEDSDERPVMSSTIVEKMPEFESRGEDDDDMAQIKSEYQRLRQKLVYKAGGYKKTENDKVADPIDQDGNPAKVSRFKAARMGLR